MSLMIAEVMERKVLELCVESPRMRFRLFRSAMFRLTTITVPSALAVTDALLSMYVRAGVDAVDCKVIPVAWKLLARTVSENTSVSCSAVRSTSKLVSTGDVLSATHVCTARALAALTATTGLPTRAMSTILPASIVKYDVAADVARGVLRLISFKSATPMFTVMMYELALLVLLTELSVKVTAAIPVF